MKLQLLPLCLSAYVSFGDLPASPSAHMADPDHLLTFTVPLLSRLPKTVKLEVVTDHVEKVMYEKEFY